MPWARLDDGIFDNPKIAALSDAAQLAHIKAIVYCARNLTDGDLASRKAREFATPRAIKELVPKLWEPTDEGFRVHDYLKYNPSREQVLRERDAAKRRMQAARSPHVRPNFERGSDAPIPVPIPDPDPSFAVGDDARVDTLAASFAKYGSVTSGTVQAIEEDVGDFCLDWVERAVKVAARSGFEGKPAWSYVHSILERWKDDGEPDDDKPKESTNGRATAHKRGNGRGAGRGRMDDDPTGIAAWKQYEAGT